jgi:PAS domain S-box-containing protein
MEVWFIAGVILLVMAFMAGFFIAKKHLPPQQNTSDTQNNTPRHVRQLQALQDIQRRIDDPQSNRAVVEAIAEAAHHLIDCSVLSFVVHETEELFFYAHPETDVSKDYLLSIRTNAIQAFSELGSVDLSHVPVSEHVEGVVVKDRGASVVEDYVNVPVVVHGEVIGIITFSNIERVSFRQENIEVIFKIISRAASMVGGLRHVISAEESKRDVVIESMPDAVIMIDDNFELMTLNKTAKEITGVEGGEFDVYDLMEAMSFDISLHNTFEEVLKTREKKVFKEVVLNKRYYDVAFSPIVEGGYDIDPLGVVIVLHDVTLKVEAEQKTREFTSMIVHELRSPLGVIRQSAELAQEEGMSEEELGDQFHMIEESAKSMLGLVNDLLDASKLEAGKIDIDPERVNIRSFLEERAEFYKHQAEQKGVEISCYRSEKVPATAQMDVEWMREAINNYLSNALKFTTSDDEIQLVAWVHKQGGDIKEELVMSRVVNRKLFEKQPFPSDLNSGLVFAVIDTGAGIPEEKSKTLFGKYRQLKSKQKGEGSGLGLFIAKGIAESHGGSVGVISKEGLGSCFYIQIPLN